MALYKQLKISVEPALADAFKDYCMKAGVSMAAELSAFMADRVNISAVPTTRVVHQPCKAESKESFSYDTRRKRRQHVGSIIQQLEAIKGYEGAYKDKIPENLQSGPAYEAAEQATDSLEQAIDLLKDAY